MREVIGELFDAKELLWQLTLRDLRIRYKQAVMGIAWAVFVPILIVLAGTIVRLAMAQVSGADLERSALGGVAVKAIPWAFFVGALGFSVNSLTGNSALVSKVYFAREVLPISAVLTQAVDSTIGALVVAAFLPLLGGTLSVALLWAPVLALALMVGTMGAALLLSCANLFFRDVKYLLQGVTMFGIFFTPVLFEATALGPDGARLIMLNPMSPIVEGLRLSLIEGHNLLSPLVANGAVVWAPGYLAYAMGWAVGAFVVGAAVFHRAEGLFAEFV